MRQTIWLAWRLLRGDGRRGALGSVLTFAAVAVTTALLLFAVAGNLAFAERGERTSWRLPEAVDDGEATAIEASSTDFVAGQRLVRLDLAATGQGTPPTPPGMDDFPEPGEVWVSPALAELIESLPDEQLADRFPSAPAGELGDEALIHSEELVAVVGRDADDPAMTTSRDDFRAVSPTPIDGFDSSQVTDAAATYRILMAAATVFLTVPLLVFGGAAARLTVARRDQRLAALRLVGATPRQVVGLTAIEAMITAALGALAGAALYLAAMPALARIPIQGGDWYVSDLWPGFGWLAATLLAVPAVVGLSAVAGLRRVVVSPLGVARRHTPPGLRAIRVAVFAVMAVSFLAATQLTAGMGTTGQIVLLLLLAGAFAALNLVGAFTVSVIGRIVAGTARRASTLLAGRRMIDDPRSAWRTVAGVALTGFVAGFMVLLAPGQFAEPGDAATLRAAASEAEAEALADELSSELSEVAEVRILEDKYGNYGDDETASVLEITSSDADADADGAADEVRTSAAQIAPQLVWESTADDMAAGEQMLNDLRTGTLTVLAASLLLATVSAGITAASSVLDRRQVYALLRLSGTPMSTLNSARRKETLIPLAVMGGGSLFAGIVLALPFLNPSGVSRFGLAMLATTVVLGLAAILAAGALSRPLLRAVTLNPTPRPD
ncbi:MAG: FtsX-like permease family protein [Stackebrandtia sp.]